jgi:hypothetical protein
MRPFCSSVYAIVENLHFAQFYIGITAQLHNSASCTGCAVQDDLRISGPTSGDRKKIKLKNCLKNAGTLNQ